MAAAMNIDDEHGQEPGTASWSKLSQIQAKLETGAALSKEDLQGLQQCLLQNGDNSRSSTGSISSTSGDGWTPPTLNRNFLDRWNDLCPSMGASSSYRLVRHFGMVQDMMDPEYYVAEVQGQSMHFRDPPSTILEATAAENNNPGDDPFHGHEHLSERQPLLVVPVPYASTWFATQAMSMAQDRQGGDLPESSVVIPESPLPSQERSDTGSRKRDRDDEVEDLALQGGASKLKTNNSNSKSNSTPPRGTNMECEEEPTSTPASDATSLAGGVHGQESDWWPAGTLQSPVNECPVLAKFYYDQYPHTHPSSNNDKLRLNDLVETIGIVSMDPWEADFASARDEDFYWMLSPSLPPPSRLPRLHVLSFRRVDLDAFVATKQQQQQQQLECSGSLLHQYEEQPSLTQELAMDGTHLGRNPLKAWNELFASMELSTTLSETLFLTLVAKAERKQNTGEIQRGLEHALGCASLQLVCPTNNAADLLYQQLHQFLQHICPVMTGMDFTSTATTEGHLPPGVLSVPTKESGHRIEPNPWQLPSGATILIRAPNINNSWNYHPTVRPIVEELCSQHRLAYKFEGGMKVPFDADYRIIVVSCSTGEKNSPLSCTLQLTLNGMGLADTDAETTNSLFPTDPQTLQELRRALAQGRCRTTSPLSSSNGISTLPENVGLPPLVLEQAQQDFLHRRGHARRTHQQEPSLTTPTMALPEEADFHRWLTLTRLYARARGQSLATTADWESALGLDDTIRASYS